MVVFLLSASFVVRSVVLVLSGLVVWPCRLLSSSGPVSFSFPQRGHGPGHRPKDRSSGRYPQVRMIYLDVGPAIVFFYLFPIVSSCVSVSALPPRAFDPQAGASGRASTCRARSPWGLQVLLSRNQFSYFPFSLAPFPLYSLPLQVLVSFHFVDAVSTWYGFRPSFFQCCAH